MFQLPLCLPVVYYLSIFIQGQMLGPADMIFQSFEYCDPETKTVDLWIDAKKYNRSVEVLDIFLNTPIDIDEAITGPADMIFQSFEYCDPETKTVDLWIDAKKYNRSVEVLDIFLNTPIDIDEAITVELNASMKKEGGWKPGSFYYKDMACKAAEKILGDIFFDILHMVDLEKCPLPADDYKIKDFVFDNAKFTVPQVYGDYKMDIFMYQGKEDDAKLISCSTAYYAMVEKEDNDEE